MVHSLGAKDAQKCSHERSRFRRSSKDERCDRVRSIVMHRNCRSASLTSIIYENMAKMPTMGKNNQEGADNMLAISKKNFWFVVGSQHLYGEEAFLQEVRDHTAEMVKRLNDSGNLPYPVVLQELAVTADTITKIMKEVNYRDEVAGVITWMHTFSPAKMWIRGTKLLQKPLLHLATQYNERIPWGDHRYGLYEFESGSPWGSRIWFYQCAFAETKQNRCRLLKKETVQKEIAAWMDVAVAYNESFAIKVARFGDNMRNVGVTEGDKVEAQTNLVGPWITLALVILFK